MNKKQTIRLNESQLKSVITEAVKRVLNEGYNTRGKGHTKKQIKEGWLNSNEENDIRKTLADMALDAVHTINPNSDFVSLGGSGDSCGVYNLCHWSELSLSEENSEVIEEYIREGNESLLDDFLSHYPKYRKMVKNGRYPDEYFEYMNQYGYESDLVGREEIKIELEGSMYNRGWYIYDISSVQSLTVTANKLVYDESTGQTIVSETVFEKEFSFGDTEDDVESFDDLPKEYETAIRTILYNAAKSLLE